MSKIILSFLLMFLVFFFGFKAFFSLTKKEKLSLTKYVLYSTLCSALAVAVLVFIVILF